MTKKLKIITRNGEITMAIELKTGTRGTRSELLYTFTKDFLDENGIKSAGLVHMRPKNDIGYNAVCYAVKTKYGFMCSLDSHDILTYMGDGIWDLRIKEKSDDEKSFE
ncbi:hypothetical protein HMPREF5175_00732 [Lactobacillus gasseri SV-16A-US]|jgi:hypothetical protein|nr:hypothetical protein HMPREF5175_00732 [Lactobacillus gasseri SV-16A-US]